MCLAIVNNLSIHMHGSLIVWKVYSIRKKKRVEAARVEAMHRKEVSILKREMAGMMRGQDETSAIRRLRQNLVKMAKGELAMRLAVWRTRMLRSVAEDIMIESYDLNQEMGRQAAAKIRQIEEAAEDQSKGVALRCLSATIMRLMKGEVAFLCRIWRQRAQVSAHEALTEMQRAMEAEMCVQGQSSALTSLQEILSHLLRGDIGLRLVVWRTNILEEMRQEEIDSMQRELQQAIRGTGLRQMKQILARFAAGELGMRVNLWRGTMMDSHHSVVVRHFAAMESKLRDQMQSTAVRMLQDTIVRLVRGDLGLRVSLWKRWVEQEIVIDDMSILERDLLDKAADAAQGAGIRLVMQIMTRMMKGEV